ncbi:relaxase/mobilization nuclease domain-containing protein [Kitasatospora sp. NPDC048365]|uniref:relaxase/mobilization nuclease domain-containing protein n=1 Tax=Kitasatospora sp. NPDC048365 TaxID=3364050 RepID=UPI00370FFB50
MIPKKAREGTDTGGLLAYLYGPGKRDEHEDPHLVASWEPDVSDPAECSGTTVWDLGLLLDAPVEALSGLRPTEHVYHVAVRIAPEDEELSDAQWAEVARAMMDAAGIAPRGDHNACRWVAVRHAWDHIHIVATKARQDGHRPNLRQDIVRMQELARDFERRWGLRRLVSGDRTAVKWPTTGEMSKSERRGLPSTARELLNVAVRSAAATAVDEADFFVRLDSAGVRVRRRVESDGSVVGYAVALPGDRDGASRPVWFAGSKLAFDLSLPRVRERWSVGSAVPDSGLAAVGLWVAVEQQVLVGASRLAVAGPLEGAGDVAALGDLVAAAAVVASPVAACLRLSSEAFERASRAPGRRGLDGEARSLFRGAARVLSDAPLIVRNDVAALLGILSALLAAVTAAERWHLQQGYRAQAESAGKAGCSVREACERVVGIAAWRPAAPGRVVGGAGRGDSPFPSAVVREALPVLAEAVLADSAWSALSARLHAVSGSGHDPGQVLAAVAAHRELDSAASVAQVLVWRLDGWLSRCGSAAGQPAEDRVKGSGTPSRAARRQSQHAPRRPADQGPDGPKRAR